MRKFLFSLFTLLTVFISNLAVADDFISFDFIRLDMDIEGDSANPTAMGINFGSAVGESVDLEVFLAIGLNEDELWTEQFFGQTYSLSGDLSKLIGFGLKARSPGDSASMYGKIGVAMIEWDIIATISDGFSSVSGSVSYDKTGPYFGFGLEMPTSDSGAFQIEYLMLPTVDVEGSDLESNSININFRKAL